MSNKFEDINIIYSAIIKGKHTILTEYTECSGNFYQIIENIMKEIINKFEEPPNIYRTYFYYGQYAIFLIKYNKIYILIMFPNTKINNNEIIFSLLYSLFEKLKTTNDLEKITKMKAQTLNHFAEIIKEQINTFNSNCQAFISFLKYSKQFILYEPFEDRYFEVDAQLPILSNIQVHSEKKKNEESEKEENDISFRKSYNSIMTQDSFKEDILKEKNATIKEEDGDILINKNSIEENNFIFKEKERNEFKIKKLKWVIIIIIIILILGVIGFLLYYIFNKN